MAKGSTCGVTNPCMRANGTRIKSVAKAYMCGQMEGSIREIGQTTICMVRESIDGRMEEGTKAITRMIRSMDKGPTTGQMAAATMENG